MYKLVIFDLDGTLLDTIKDLAHACNYVLRKWGLEEHPINQYKTYVGDGVYKLIERMLPKDYQNNEKFQQAKVLFDAYYAEHSLDYTKPYAGIIPLLQRLKDKGIHLAVASNKPHIYTQELVKLMFKGKIEVAFGQREGIPVKPDPEVITEIRTHFDISAKDCLYVGDSNVDIYTAKNAGLTSVGVLWGFRTKRELVAAGADHIVANIQRLEQLILNSES